MEKKNLIQRMTSFCKGAEMITTSKVRAFTGYGANKAADILEGLDYIPGGGGERRYFIPDVAERIIERSVRSGR